jgi:hypothetical protein
MDPALIELVERVVSDNRRLFDEKTAEIIGHVDQTAAETRRHVDQTAAETRRHVEETAAETRRQVEETAAETRRQVEETAAETRRHFEVSTESLRSEIRLVAEGVSANTERIDVLRAEMKADSAETRSLLRLSYSQLDRRLTDLESVVAELQHRMARLESTAH